MYDSGLTVREIAAKQQLPKATVQGALARAGVGMRPAARGSRNGNEQRP
jgi:hypothetical protein